MPEGGGKPGRDEATFVMSLLNDKHVMGWGRWKSKTFTRYQKFKINQRKWVFKKVGRILNKSKNIKSK